VGGIRTNLAFFRQILEDAEFRAGQLHTGFIDEFWKRRPPLKASDELNAVAALAAALHTAARTTRIEPAAAIAPASRWRAEGRDGLLR